MRNKRKSVLNYRSSRQRLTLLLAAFLLEITTFSVCSAQTHFKEQKEGYGLTLPSSGWRPETRVAVLTMIFANPVDKVRLFTETFRMIKGESESDDVANMEELDEISRAYLWRYI